MIQLACDTGAGVGLGHQRRMEALASALEDLGAEPVVKEIGEGPLDGDVVVVDSYSTRADGNGVRARRVAAVDDLERDLAVDLVIDPAPTDRVCVPARASRGVSTHTRVLRGLRYALVDPELAAREVPPVRDEVESVLVAMGGADASGVGGTIARSVLELVPGADVRLVVGPWSSPDVPDGVKPVRGSAGLADELLAADVVLCSSGVTLLEALTLGRPSVALLTAANQRRYFDGLVAADAVVGTTAQGAAAAALDLAADLEARRRQSEIGRRLVDGSGARRVAEAIVELL